MPRFAALVRVLVPHESCRALTRWGGGGVDEDDHDHFPAWVAHGSDLDRQIMRFARYYSDPQLAEIYPFPPPNCSCGFEQKAAQYFPKVTHPCSPGFADHLPYVALRYSASRNYPFGARQSEFPLPAKRWWNALAKRRDLAMRLTMVHYTLT